MAADKIIHGRINLNMIEKDWLFKGEKVLKNGKKGLYLDFVMFYTEEQDDKGQNGMIKQSVPSDIFKKEKKLAKEDRTQGAILGNLLEFSSDNSNEENRPGYTGKSKKQKEEDEEEEEEETNEEVEQEEEEEEEERKPVSKKKPATKPIGNKKKRPAEDEDDEDDLPF